MNTIHQCFTFSKLRKNQVLNSKKSKFCGNWKLSIVPFFNKQLYVTSHYPQIKSYHFLSNRVCIPLLTTCTWRSVLWRVNQIITFNKCSLTIVHNWHMDFPSTWSYIWNMVMMIHDNITNQDVPLPAATGCYLSWELNVQWSLFLVGVSGVTGVTAVLKLILWFILWFLHSTYSYSIHKCTIGWCAGSDRRATEYWPRCRCLHSPLSTGRLSPLHAGLLATCYGSSGEAVYLAEDGY